MAQLNNHGLWWWEVMISSNKEEFTRSILVTSAAVMFAVLWYKFTNSSTKPPLPPGPRSLPIVGKLHVVINSLQLAKAVVRDHDEIFANGSLTVAASVMVITYEGQDLVWSENNSNWRNLRRIFFYEAMSNKNLEACSSFKRDEIRNIIKNVFSKIGTPIDISDIAFVTQTNVITSLICGNTSDSHLGSELQMVAWNIVEIYGRPNLSDFFPILSRFDLQRVERDMKNNFIDWIEL
ncbi:putative cytochrome P450 [Helianthus anomalus]